MSAPAISAWCSAQLFFWLAGVAPLGRAAVSLNQILPALLVFAVAYFAINSWLITIVISLERHLKPLQVWRNNFVWLSLNYFCGASVAVLVVFYNRDIDIGFIGVIIPLLMLLYFTFKISMDRVEDADRHVAQLNTLYLSTIETLAMAIDAKDQVTHGHVRRVQRYAVALAKSMGIVDENEIKAIEAAALLHDMGKLAVPEYILNKPGTLTPAEFEKMKLHASVGADILSAIDFPYPVVPIVRHHHESWNGMGYPAGLKGTDIPIGARILSVVDCFDALTSDRPYRPRLSDEEAINILLKRRASMYDPLIVDTFVRVYKEIAPERICTDSESNASNEIGATQDVFLPINSPRLGEIAAGPDEMLTLYELARALAGQASINDTGETIAKHLRRLIPFSLCVVYSYDAASDELEATYAMGDASSLVMGVKVQLGQRLSGWVAANRRTIINSEPTLDLGDIAEHLTPRLRSCLSTPLLSDDQLVAVLTLYSANPDGFNEDHRRIIEVVARQTAHIFKHAAEFISSSLGDPLTELPHLKQLQQIIDATGIDRLSRNSPFTLLFIEVPGLTQINSKHGNNVGDDVLRRVIRHSRSGLRVADILFRYGTSGFVALLNNTDTPTGKALAHRMLDDIGNDQFQINGGGTLTIEATVTCVTAPKDGESLDELAAAARLRLEPWAYQEAPSRVH